MYRQLAEILRGQGVNIFSLHPLQLSRLLEVAWHNRTDANVGAAEAATEARLPGTSEGALLDWLRWPPGLDAELALGDGPVATGASTPTPLSAKFQATTATQVQPTWDHLIYAYMIENTNIYEVFARVVRDYLHNERFGAPVPQLLPWLRATEEIFYRDPPPFTIASITSDLRADLRASRRNAYYRMFGMDLNHGTNSGGAYQYEKAAVANKQFVDTFESMLREVQRGITNAGNTSGPNETDDAALAETCRSLSDMLRTRRTNGSLGREEFVHVAWMSWFHLSVEADTSPIVAALRAEASSPAERLLKIAERAGVPAHSKSDSYFQMAEPLSRILLEIERKSFNDPNQVPNLYNPTAGGVHNPIRQDMSLIITHWVAATGRDVRAPRVTVTPRVAMTPAAGGPAAPAPASNGSAPVVTAGQ